MEDELVPNANPFCAEWDGNICRKCAKGSYFDPQGICVVVDPNCKEVDGNVCLSCYNGYTLDDNVCVKSTVEETADALCAEWLGEICAKCSEGTFMGENGKCNVVSPLCKTFDEMTGACLSCYQGFNIEGTACVESAAKEVSDPNCK